MGPGPKVWESSFFSAGYDERGFGTEKGVHFNMRRVHLLLRALRAVIFQDESRDAGSFVILGTFEMLSKNDALGIIAEFVSK
jgi:hypothetical protein